MNNEAIYLYGFFKGRNMPLAMKAVTRASEWHKGQTRNDGSPYINHPITVGRLLVNQHIYDDVTLAAAILHDVIDDKRATYDEVKKEFGEEVADLADVLADKDLDRIAKDIRTILIKAADRTYNIGTMVGVFDVPKLKKYVSETEEKILPMMKQARRTYLEYSDALVSFRDHIVNVIKVVKHVIELSEENARLKEQVFVQAAP